MSSNYVTIPDDDYGWLQAAVHARHELADFAELAIAILEAARDVDPDPETAT